jgi:hemerythrin-like domain-containing protein
MTDTQTHATHRATTRGVKSRLLHEHRALEQRLTQLTSALDGGDPLDIGEVWTQFERRLRDHIDSEERYLFPLVAPAHSTEVEGLRLEHQHIRCALGELGTLVDLHALRKTSVEELIVYLLQHAAREEHTLYEWVDAI